MTHTAPQPDPAPDPARTAMVVDDHPITHLGCGRLLADLGYGRVLKAMSGDEALALLDQHQPQVVVLDISLPGVGGLALIAPILERSPDSAILMFSMNDQPGFAARALAEGAHGFLSKNAPPEEFGTAIRALEAGEFYLPPRMALALATRQAGADRSAALTAREDEVLTLIGKGLALQQVADRLGVSYKTVANAASTLKRKLGVSNMTGLIRHAVERER
ncbi:MAG TPA: response regulator transcription factor [Paracoccus solventivorans]|uniref:Response regulator transcription factor n=1 Tax=Paracoccus solventivorans TaxID=53463 RepID=A0A832QWD3_9RHOB|nr:response regulator transcription factor [Paracoccus solventivorans]HHW34229.1 response regulator transcription factor [Paracoccus solventivorans]